MLGSKNLKKYLYTLFCIFLVIWGYIVAFAFPTYPPSRPIGWIFQVSFILFGAYATIELSRKLKQRKFNSFIEIIFRVILIINMFFYLILIVLFVLGMGYSM